MRVALCLSGLCRNWDEAYPPLKETIIDRYDPDIFAMVWDRDYTEVFKSTHEQALEDLQKHKLKASHVFNGSLHKFLTEDFMDSYFNQKRVSCFTSDFDKKKDLRTAWGRTNVLNMYYLIEHCNEYKTDQERYDGQNYDIVIRARIDRAWELRHELKTDPDTLFFHNLKDDLSDWFAYGPSGLMDIYSSVYRRLPSVAAYMELNSRTTKCKCGQKVASEREVHDEESRLYRNWLNPHNCLSTVLDFNDPPVKRVILAREDVRGHMIGEEERAAALRRQNAQ